MAADNLTIRNLTSTPITLKRIERFRANTGNGLTNVASNVTNVTRSLTNVTRTKYPVAIIKPNAQPFEEKELDIHVEPFKTVKTEHPAFVKSNKERLRWTIEADGESHQVQTPVPTTESATMKPLSENPRFKFTGIYVTPGAHLSVYSSANLHAWMGELKDNTLLSSLSIPGTHNAPTYHFAPPSVRCQAVSPREQLQHGVRFFDIRVQPVNPESPDKDELALVHSVFPISLTGTKYFRGLMREVNDFLDKNPSETLIMCVKREGPGNHTDEQLSRILRDHYAVPDSRWYTDPKIPTLGEARGKVVLMRRFNIEGRLQQEHEGRGWGIDAGGWADNCAHAFCPSGQVCIQDFYEILEPKTIAQKIQYVNEQCNRASQTCYPFGNADQPHPFYVNFLSASNFWKLETWPEKIAAKLNPATVDYLCRQHSDAEGNCDWSTGILVTDWVGLDGDWDLVQCVVGMNARLKFRQDRGN